MYVKILKIISQRNSCIQIIPWWIIKHKVAGEIIRLISEFLSQWLKNTMLIYIYSLKCNKDFILDKMDDILKIIPHLSIVNSLPLRLWMNITVNLNRSQTMAKVSNFAVPITKWSFFFFFADHLVMTVSKYLISIAQFHSNGMIS